MSSRPQTSSSSLSSTGPLVLKTQQGTDKSILPTQSASSSSSSLILADLLPLPGEGSTPATLRAEILTFLLAHTPEGKFPLISSSMLGSGGLQQGARVMRDSLSTVRPYPRLQGLLRLEPNATLTLFGRLFTEASDSLLRCVIVTEGLEGLRTRRRALTSETALPLIEVPGIPINPFALSQTAGRQSITIATSNSTLAPINPFAVAAPIAAPPPPIPSTSTISSPNIQAGPSTPSLQSILSALLEAALSCATELKTVGGGGGGSGGGGKGGGEALHDVEDLEGRGNDGGRRADAR
jgi:hypothetical protein